MINQSKPYRVEVQDKPAGKVIALHLACPECRRRTTFTARNESADGNLRCFCGFTVRMAGERLSVAQKRLNDSVQKFANSIQRLTRRR